MGTSASPCFAVFDVVFAVTGHRPSDATLFGGLLLSAGLGITPLLRRHFKHHSLAMRLLMLLVGPARYCPPHRLPRVRPSFLDLNGII